MTVVTGIQIRMARIALGWDAADLADKSGITANTIFRIETGSGAYASTLAKLQTALEQGGAVFIADRQPSPDGGPGVRLALDPAALVPAAVMRPKSKATGGRRNAAPKRKRR